MSSLLDPGQIIKQAFDDASGRIKVDAEVTANISGAQEVVISDADDSIKIGNGSGTYAQITVSNALKTDSSATTQPISVASLPLPSGAATSANQTTEISSLSSIDTKLSSQATATKQDTGNTSLSSIDSKITTVNTNAVTISTSLPAGTNAIGKLSNNDGVDIGDVTINNASGGSAVNIQDGGNSITVDGTIATTQSGTWNINNVSGTVSLPTGAATSVKQDTGNTSLSSIDGKLPTLVSSQVPVQNSLKSAAISSSIGSVASPNIFSVDASGYNVCYIQVSATGTTGTSDLLFQGSNNNSDWATLTFPSYSSAGSAKYDSDSLALVIAGDLAIDTSTIYKIPFKGRYFRCIVDPSSTGNVSVTVYAFLVSGDNYDSDGRVNSSYIKTQNGVLDSGQQIMTYSLPVVIANDQTPIPTTSTSAFSTRSDTFTTTTSGTIINTSTSPLKQFAIQVTPTGAVTSWDVRLEGSLDGITFTQILQHTNVTPGSGSTTFSGTLNSSCLYFRSRCSGLVLGVGTNIIVVILGMI